MEVGGIQEYQHRSRLALLKAIEQILVFSFFHAIGPLGLLIKANRAKPTDRCHVSISAACCPPWSSEASALWHQKSWSCRAQELARSRAQENEVPEKGCLEKPSS